MFKVGGRVRSGARSFLRSYVRYRPTSLDERFASLAELVRRADPSLFATDDLTRHELRVFSQNGEDGVLVEILNRIGVGPRFFVEFGIQEGVEGNCVLLADVFGWAGVFLEADPDLHAIVARKYADAPVQVVRELVTAARIDEILGAVDVPADLDVLSIDIDGNDIYVWDALTVVSPRVVVIEYNAGIRDRGPLAQPHDPARAWDGGSAFGSTVAALETVGRRKGYTLVHTDLTGCNAFFVRDDMVDAVGVDRAPRRAQNFGLTGISQPPSDPPGGWTDDHLSVAPKIAVPGVSRPRIPDQPPHTRSWPSGHSGSSRSVITKPCPASSPTQSPRVRWCST